MNAATIIIKIPYCVWREGRPRYVPGPTHQAMGYRSMDLKHDSGRWFTLAETQGWVDKLKAEITARKEQGKVKKKHSELQKPKGYLVADLLADMLRDDPKLQKAGTTKVKALSSDTRRYYQTMADTLQAFDEEVWAAPAASVSVPVAWGLYEKLYADKGLHMARGVIATCRRAWGWGIKRGKVEQNPWRGLGMETPDGRRRPATVDELRHYMAIADANKRPEMADMAMLAVFTSQRQADRLAMHWGQVSKNRLTLAQNKTGKAITFDLPAELLARLEAAMERRKANTLQHKQLVIDERANSPWKRDHYRHVHAGLIKLAMVAMPSIADLRDQDWRDTALTWARQGGAEFEKRRMLSGHSQQSAALEEKAYLGDVGTEGTDAVNAILTVWRGKE